MRERANFLRHSRDFLSEEARVAPELADVGWVGAQHFLTISLHGRKLAQPGSNLKKLDRGIFVVLCMRRGHGRT